MFKLFDEIGGRIDMGRFSQPLEPGLASTWARRLEHRVTIRPADFAGEVNRPQRLHEHGIEEAYESPQEGHMSLGSGASCRTRHQSARSVCRGPPREGCWSGSSADACLDTGYGSRHTCSPELLRVTRVTANIGSLCNSQMCNEQGPRRPMESARLALTLLIHPPVTRCHFGFQNRLLSILANQARG